MSLSTSLSIAVQALNAADGALAATNNNIANANTPGYSRQTVILQQAAPTAVGNLSAGNGVVLEGYQSVRDELLQLRIQQQTTVQSGANAETNSLQQIQPLFTTSTQDIGTQMSALFASFSSLSTDPTNSSLRQSVISSGQNLATSFNSTANSLTSQQSGLNAQVTQDVSQINQLSQQIAALNPQISALKSNGQDGGSLQDKQDQLVLTLSGLTSVSITQSESGVTLTTGNGTALVVGAQSFALQTKTVANGAENVLDQNGKDVTSAISGGDLGGTIQSRDTTIAGLLTSLDTLANQFATAINGVQKTGFDQNGTAGTNLFSVPATVAGSAAAISFTATNPTAIAASSDGSSGSGGNLTNFAALQSSNLLSGQTPTAAYASIVFQVGSLTANASAQSSATASSLLQLNDQRSSVSGVSINEESANLIQFQQAFQAAARVVSTLQSLFQITMSMGTAGAA